MALSSITFVGWSQRTVFFGFDIWIAATRRTNERMVSCRGLLLLVVVVLGVSGSAVAQEVPRTVMDTNYRESLVFHQLLDGKVHALFNFSQSTLLGTNASDNLHFSFFPKAVGEIVSEFGLLELHLTMTQGRWDYEDWGYPATASSPPPGAQLWAYLTRYDHPS